MKKKMITIGLIILAVGFLSFQLLVAKSSNDTLKYSYLVEKTIDNVEIRNYSSANFARVVLKENDFNKMANSGFRVLAGYIFGGNQEGKSISMTSPVIMEMNEQKTMEFMMPNDISLDSLPLPNNSEIEIITKPDWNAAAITFGGYANSQNIEHYKNELFKVLNNNGIKFNENFKYLGYNPPYQLINRKNEIVVELIKPVVHY